MYNETYDEYIRSILGYPPIRGYNNYQDNNNQNISYENRENTNLEKYYPEIYKIVYPMITKKCNNIRSNLTNEDIENMTDEIFYALEERKETHLNINLTNDVRTTQQSNLAKTIEKKPDVEIKETTSEKRENRQTNRELRDLIKILLIRELLNRPGRPPMPRPPMSGPGIRPPVRPPFRPGAGRNPFNREFETSNYDIFEY